MPVLTSFVLFETVKEIMKSSEKIIKNFSELFAVKELLRIKKIKVYNENNKR